MSQIIEIVQQNILNAITTILSNPENIKNEALSILERYQREHKNKNRKEIIYMASQKIISNYSNYTGCLGAATSVTSIIPGIGTTTSLTIGTSADIVATIKYQIEMTMALATIYGHNILDEEVKKLCLILFLANSISNKAEKKLKQISTKVLVNLIQQYLKGPILIIIKKILQRIGIVFTKKALAKSIPFGVGIIIGFSVNKVFTIYFGKQVCDYFNNC
ncbi:EcsC family protein [Aliarcobacter cryaerophilus]|uniref:EcsC family protein n=1 Tax=Aliarcobacter cryaerophilus TaxID=28198 RepID=UPI003DA2193F